MSAAVDQKPVGSRPIKGPIVHIPKRQPPDFTVEDSLPGAQFTTFEEKKGAEKDKKAEIDVKKMSEVVEIPENVPNKDFQIDKDKIVTFSGRTHWLSDFYRSPAKIDGNEYPSVEHYYQACKLYMLAGARFSNQIRRIPDPGQVKVTAKLLLRGIATPQQIEAWKIKEGPRLLEYGMMHKFVQNPKLRAKLLETGDSLLVHCYDKDKIFANNMTKEKFDEWAKENDGKTLKIPSELSPETLQYFPLVGDGKNIAGLIAMRVRDQIRRYVESVQSAASASGEDGAVDGGATASSLVDGDAGFDAVLSAALNAVNLNSDSLLKKVEEEEKKEVKPIKRDNRYLE